MSRHSEIGKRIVKYALEGLMVAFAALIIPQKNSLNAEDILSLALVASATFAIALVTSVLVFPILIVFNAIFAATYVQPLW